MVLAGITVFKANSGLCITLRIYTHTHTAGHYVPATAQVIVESNSIYAQNLKGIAIGNGWVDPYTQYGAYAQVQDL